MTTPPNDRRFGAVVFDFDGTILDTETPVYETARDLYEEHGLSAPTQPQWVASIGQSSQPFDIYDQVISLAALDVDRDTLVERRRQRLRAQVSQLDYRAGILDWLAAAERTGCAVAIASSSPTSWVQSHLVERGLTDRFPVVSCAGDGVPGKPDPTVYASACEQLGVDPFDAVAIEDSPTGAHAAVNAGLFCIAVPGPMTQALNHDVADLVLDSLAAADPADWLQA